LHPGPGLTQPSTLKWSVNEYRLRPGRREGLRQVCATLLGARHVPEHLCGGLVPTWGAITNVHLYGGSHSVTFHPIQVNTPRLNRSQTAWRDGWLSWPRRLVTYRDGLPVSRQSPIQVVTGPTVEQLCWSRPPTPV